MHDDPGATALFGQPNTQGQKTYEALHTVMGLYTMHSPLSTVAASSAVAAAASSAAGAAAAMCRSVELPPRDSPQMRAASWHQWLPVDLTSHSLKAIGEQMAAAAAKGDAAATADASAAPTRKKNTSWLSAESQLDDIISSWCRRCRNRWNHCWSHCAPHQRDQRNWSQPPQRHRVAPLVPRTARIRRWAQQDKSTS